MSSTHSTQQTVLQSESEFTATLRRLRASCAKSQAEIARDSWVDESYVSKLLSGERANPSRDALILIAVYGMALSLEQTDELLLAGNFKPLVLTQSLR